MKAFFSCLDVCLVHAILKGHFCGNILCISPTRASKGSTPSCDHFPLLSYRGTTPPAGSPLLLQFISPNPPVLDPVLLPLQKPHSALGVKPGLPWGPRAPPRGLQLQEKDTGPKSLTNETSVFNEVQGQVI